MKYFLAFALLAIPGSASAGPLHYIKTHKAVLARDAIFAGAYLAAAKTEPCYKPAPCSDTSYWFPAHPTRPQVYGAAIGISAGLSTINHLLYRFDPDPDKRTANILGWMAAGLIGVNEGFDVHSNLSLKKAN